MCVFVVGVCVFVVGVCVFVVGVCGVCMCVFGRVLVVEIESMIDLLLYEIGNEELLNVRYGLCNARQAILHEVDYLFVASRGPMPSADGLASVTGMAKPCQTRIRGWHGLFSASRGPMPSADGPGHPRIIHLMQNRLPCIAKTVSYIQLFFISDLIQ